MAAVARLTKAFGAAAVVARVGRRSARLPAERWSPVRALQTLQTRAASTVTFTYVDGEGEAKTVTAAEGATLADVAHDNDIELECACAVGFNVLETRLWWR
jgi:hypothetical protein